MTRIINLVRADKRHLDCSYLDTFMGLVVSDHVNDILLKVKTTKLNPIVLPIFLNYVPLENLSKL